MNGAWISARRIVPLAAPANAAETETLRDGLLAGGIDIVEIGLRTAYAPQAIRDLAADGRLLVGAGTVLTAAQAERTVRDGAAFLVSPGFSESVVDAGRRMGVPVLPGVATASEVMRALELGLDLLKLFPANALGGIGLLSAFESVFPTARFVPSGGVSNANLREHLDHPAVAAVSGSWVTSGALLAQGAEAVAAEARAAVEIVDALGIPEGGDAR